MNLDKQKESALPSIHKESIDTKLTEYNRSFLKMVVFLQELKS